MANNLDKNVSEIVLQKFIPGFMDSAVLLNTVDRQVIQGDINENSGETVQLKRPHQYAVERTSDGDLSAASTSNLISATATATTSNMATVWVEWKIVEQALELNQLDQILMPAQKKLVSELENELGTKMVQNAGLTSGTIGTKIDAWGDVAYPGALMNSIGVDGEMFAVMNPFSVTNLADTQSGLASGSNNLVDTAWKRAQISGNFGGLQAFTSNSLTSYTVGTASGAVAVNGTPTVTYTALRNTYQLTLDLDGLGAAETITAGTQLEFPATFMLNQQNKETVDRDGAAVPFVGTVTTDATANGSGEISVTISGAPIFDATNPQYNTVSRAIADNDVVNILGTASTRYQPALAYSKDYFGMGTVDLDPLVGWDSTVINEGGLSIRCTKYSDATANKQLVRFDILPAYVCMNPFFGMQFFGN